MIVVACAHDPGYAEMASISMPLVERYCAKHSYGFVYHPDVEPTAGDACKIGLFRKLYSSGQFEGADLFFWLDTDALIMNSKVPLETFLPQMGEAHVMYGCDINGINSGAWFARFTSRADNFLWVAQQTSVNMGWADQPGIFQCYLQPIFTPWVKIVPGKGFNSMEYELYGWPYAHGLEINKYEEGDLVLHFAGIEMSRRIELMREYAALAK